MWLPCLAFNDFNIHIRYRIIARYNLVHEIHINGITTLLKKISYHIAQKKPYVFRISANKG